VDSNVICKNRVLSKYICCVPFYLFYFFKSVMCLFIIFNTKNCFFFNIIYIYLKISCLRQNFRLGLGLFYMKFLSLLEFKSITI
jgi:hypothetical protein